jgi:hypothetical protein
MNPTTKNSSTTIVNIILLFSLLVLAIPYATVQAVSKPSVPQFSVKLVDNLIEVTIKNQPFAPFNDESAKNVDNGSDMYGPNGKEFNLYYDVQVKGHRGEWNHFCNYIVQSNSSYTVVSQSSKYDVGTQLDFKVSAVIMYKYNFAYDPPSIVPPAWGLKTEIQSDWSDVQTFTVSSSSPLQTAILSPPSVTSDEDNGQTQFPSQTQPPNNLFINPFFLLGFGVLLGGVVVAVVIMFHRRHTKTSDMFGLWYCTVTEVMKNENTL